MTVVVLHLGIVLNPGYFSHDEWEKWDHVSKSGFRDFMLAYGRVQSGPEFGYPVRPLGFLQQGFSALFMVSSPLLVHLGDVLFHAGTAVALLTALLRCGAPRNWALLAALCFAASPLATASTGWMAASFDRWYALFVLLSCTEAIRAMQSGLTPARGIALVVWSSAAILSKETSVVLPGAVLVSILAAWLIAPVSPPLSWTRLLVILVLVCLPIVAYLAVRIPAIVATLEGRAVATYSPSTRYLGRNLLGYWAFPFLPHMTDFPRQSRLGLPAYVGAALLHAGLAALVGYWSQWRVAFLYIAAYFLCLMPVLTLAEPGSHYLYASGIPFALALAFAIAEAWRRARWMLLPLGVSAGLMLMTNAFIQLRLYRDGLCQDAFLETLDARLAESRGSGRRELAVTFEPGVREWVARRAIHDRPAYDGREGDPTVRLILNGHLPEGALRAVTGSDCRVRGSAPGTTD
ncbi:hypothetical protein [Sabulicella rubraurantiaca]|uniref:hypothetical protein n=1 Tax=Sabulicella rubraurantiaca TaxID=2811429 RepID=UPI001A9625C9|nr:hypothetical protein [Sabulicella rubraurantiaca]